MMEAQRIDTLIVDMGFSPKKSLGTLDTTATPWSIAAKLGRYVLSDDSVDRDAMAGDAAGKLADLYGLGIEAKIADDVDLNSVERLLCDKAHDTIAKYACKDQGGMRALIVIVDGSMPATYLGSHAWGLRSRRGAYETVVCCRLATYVGASMLVNDDETLAIIIAENGRKFWWSRVSEGIASRREFMTNAEQLWDEEACRESNRRYARSTGKHIATVFEDKKQCDNAHRDAAQHGTFADMFAHVEIDDDVDLPLYDQLQDEFAKRWDNGELPRISTHDNALRFRKTGRHKAIGVYCNALHAIAVDPRSPRSLLHEFAHAYDFEHGQLSCAAGFKGIYHAYCDNLDTSSLSETKIHYYRTPTEVFARAWEIYAVSHGIGGSFVDTPDQYDAETAYKPLLDGSVKKMLDEYFSRLGKDDGR